jgi:hypothetical protein
MHCWSHLMGQTIGLHGDMSGFTRLYTLPWLQSRVFAEKWAILCPEIYDL